MAKCFPDYVENPAPFTSAGEEKLYWSLREQLPEDYSVFHSVAWIGRSPGGAIDGEADFLICHPQRGLLIIEVKGGLVSVESSGRWTSTDRHEQTHQIKDPFDQAKRSKYHCLDKLKEHSDWRRLGRGRICAGHAAFFPDVDDATRLRGPNAPVEIIGDRTDIPQLRNWVDGAFAHWSGHGGGHESLGGPGVELVQRIFARTTTTRPLSSARIASEEEQRIILTNQQIAILDVLSRQRRALISGGAGTGKTIIAREKALRLARDGFKTLLTCYNRPLADHLREGIGSEKNLDVASFHQLCHHLVDRAEKELRRDLVHEARQTYSGGDLYDVLQPAALAFAADAFGPQYDAIVVDEAQDFADEYWMPLEFLLKDSQLSPLYVFLDENQDVYARTSSFPDTTGPYVLTRNCRNTEKIHGAAYRYYNGLEVEAPPIPGTAIIKLEARGDEKQALLIARNVSRMISDENVAPSDIGVLIGDRQRRGHFEQLLMKNKLPKQARWSKLEGYGAGSVTVDTVARFKGLERAVVFLWGVDDLPSTERSETLYVGLSRAKSILFLCGSPDQCRSIC